MANQTTGYRGRDAALYLKIGTQYVKIAGLQTNNVTINNNPVDITNMGSGGFQEWMPDAGVWAMTISADGFVVEDADRAFESFCELAESRDFLPLQFERANGIIYEGDFVAADLTFTNTHDGAQQFNVTLQSSGPVAITRPT